MQKKETFRDLVVWRKAVAMTKTVYVSTGVMPGVERYGLTQQMRRAAVSVPSNIAEGNARMTLTDYVRFLAMARGSLAELETQILIAAELGMLKRFDHIIEAINDVRRLLQALIRSLEVKRQREGRR